MEGTTNRFCEFIVNRIIEELKKPNYICLVHQYRLLINHSAKDDYIGEINCTECNCIMLEDEDFTFVGICQDCDDRFCHIENCLCGQDHSCSNKHIIYCECGSQWYCNKCVGKYMKEGLEKPQCSIECHDDAQNQL